MKTRLDGPIVGEWSSSIPVAFCSKMMADIDAYVIKIEEPQFGDELKGILGGR